MNEPADLLRLDWGWVDDTIDAATVPRLAEAAVTRLGYPVLQYAEPAGLPELREEIAREAAAVGLHVAAPNVCVTNGATGAIDLLTRLLLDGVGESITLLPAFDTALEILRQNSAAVHGVPFDPFAAGGQLPDDVWREIEVHARNGRCRVFYSAPNHHNPTGTSLSGNDRARLLDLCRTHGLTLIEDDPYRLFSASHVPLDGEPLPLYAYVGSFSKEIFPALRCGYAIASTELVERVTRLQKYTTSSANCITQAICLEALLSGTADRIRAHRRDAVRRKEVAWDQAWKALGFDHLASSAGCSGPYRWIALRDRTIGSRELVRAAMDRGVAVVPGGIYLLDDDVAAVRVSLLRIAEHDVQEAAARLFGAFEAAVNG